MLKRIVFGSLFGLIILAAVIYLFPNQEEKVEDSMFRSIPLDAAFIVDVSDFQAVQQIISPGSIWFATLNLTFLQGIQEDLRILDSLQHFSGQISDLLKQQHPILISGHPFGKDEIQNIFYFKVPSENDYQSIDRFIQSDKHIIDRSSHSYEGSTIQDIRLQGNQMDGFAYTWVKGMLIWSKASILVENAVRQLKSDNTILDQNGLKEILKTAGKTANINFYINLDQLPRITSTLIQSKYKQDIRFFQNTGSWAELDLNIKADLLIFNGFSTANVLQPGFASLFKEQKPVKLESFDKIPAQATTFGIIGISNLDKYNTEYSQIETSNAKRSEIQTSQQETNYNTPLKNIFDHEAGFVFLKKQDDSLQNSFFSIVRVRSKEDALNLINRYISDYAEKNNNKSLDYISEVKLESGESIRIYALPFANIPKNLFGKIFSFHENPYCYISDNYMIFGNTPESLQNYANLLASGKGLHENETFSSLSEYFSSASNFFFYTRPGESLDMDAQFLKKEFVGHLKKDEDKLSIIQAFIYQFNTGENGLIYNSIFIKSAVSIPKKEITVNWQLNLDGNLSSKPYIFNNGNDKEPDVVIQDTRNLLYLISSQGKVEWKTQLDGQIQGEIHTMDYYKNGKLQLVFNTKNKIYLLDRHGKNVEKFPLHLPVAATNGIALVDYDKKRDYRILYADANKKIIELSKEGLPIEGWNAEKTESRVTQAIIYFRHKEKDMLVITDKHHLYVLDRKGKKLFNFPKSYNIDPNCKVFFLKENSLDDSKFIFTDTTGKVFMLTPKKEEQWSQQVNLPVKHWFDAEDLNDDGNKEFIFTWGNTLKAFSQQKKELFTITLDHPISFRPIFLNFGSKDTRIGLVTNDNKVYMYTYKGLKVKGFPLEGCSEFSVIKLKNTENNHILIVGNNSNILTNYIVQ